MPKLKRKTIVIFILALITVYIICEVLPGVWGALASTEVLEYGRLTVSDEAKCLIVRDETVYKADKTGEIKVLVSEGELIKKGLKLMEFEEAPEKADQVKDDQESGVSSYKELIRALGDALKTDKKHKSARKGVFSFYIDGNEAKLTPKTIKDIKEGDIQNMDRIPENLERTNVTKGDPIYKIADNSKWYIIFWIDEGDISKYEKGNSVTVKTDDGNFKATVDNISKEGSRWKVVLASNRYFKKYAETRVIEAEVVTVDTEGLLVSNDCLTTKDKKVGCYVRNTAGDYVFKQVQTLATDGEKTLVTEKEFFDKKGKQVNTVKAYDEVKRN